MCDFAAMLAENSPQRFGLTLMYECSRLLLRPHSSVCDPVWTSLAASLRMCLITISFPPCGPVARVAPALVISHHVCALTVAAGCFASVSLASCCNTPAALNGKSLNFHFTSHKVFSITLGFSGMKTQSNTRKALMSESADLHLRLLFIISLNSCWASREKKSKGFIIKMYSCIFIPLKT